MNPLNCFREVVLVDFEFRALPGERPQPVCLVAHELRSGRRLRLWADELAAMPAPPWPAADDVLFVAFYASAELGCCLSLGWPLPTRILDPFVEFRCLTNGRSAPCGSKLLGALAWFGIDCIAAVEKESMRELAIRGGPYSEVERMALLDYCETDVVALSNLLRMMLPHLDVPRALLRGRYMAAAARMEHNGVPIDTEVLATLRKGWPDVKARLVAAVDSDFGVYAPIGRRTADARDGVCRFSAVRFAGWLAAKNIPWPRLDSGALDLSDETFRQMARRYPAVAPLRELRHTLSQLRLNDLAVGADGRNRCLLSVFQAKTGRNQPSNSKFIFGPSCWLRALIRPQPGRAVAYLDWSAQEIGIAAALSGDPAMQNAYRSGDPYLWLAKAGGFIPADATKRSHAGLRDTFKVVYLAANYGMGERSLAQLIGQPEVYARELLRLHRKRFPRFWLWSDGALSAAMLGGRLWTVFGWQVTIGPDTRPTSLRNFPVQANGAEMLRLACCLATERAITVCAPVHDALLIEADDAEIGDAVQKTQAAMQEAAEIVLDGFSLRTDAKIVRYPDRYLDPRGAGVWSTVQTILAGLPMAAATTDASC